MIIIINPTTRYVMSKSGAVVAADINAVVEFADSQALNLGYSCSPQKRCDLRSYANGQNFVPWT
jgi:hypothetical protein